MILDLETYVGPADPQAQVCIVGAGAVGTALAVALANMGVDVLVLEGGGERLEMRSQDLHRGESIGHPFRSIDVGRYRVLGGTTTFWGGQVIPFDGHVTGERAWLGYDAWPIPADELQALFKRTFAHIGLADVELANPQVWKKLGVEPPELGEDLNIEITRWLRTRNFAKLYGKVLRADLGPRVMLHANAVALEMEAGSNTVRAVRARSLGGREIAVRARHVVLANGSLESVRLLHQPLFGGKPAPWAGSTWLGAPLIDHLDCIAGDVKVLDYQRFHECFDNIFLDGLKYYPKIRMAPAMQKREGLVDIAAQFVYRTRLSEHFEFLTMFLRSVREGGSEVRFRDLPAHVAAVASAVVPLAVRYFRDRRSFKPMDAQVALVFYCEQRPCQRSRIALADERDALGMPRLRVNWQFDGSELRTMRLFGQLLKGQLAAKGLATVQLDPLLEAEDPAFMGKVQDAVHQMGTLRMAKEAANGFVDPQLRVHGIDNLFVAGAAVFPTTGFANPTFTAIALALRLADQLAEDCARG